MNLRSLTALFLFLTMYLSEASAACTYYRGPCYYQNKFYSSGERWETDKCEVCRCKSRGRGFKCCTNYWTPWDVPEDCTAVWNQKQCEYKIVQIKDETKECKFEPLSGVLKRGAV
ncbi:Prostate-associated microseminoprotein [Holothuria leucospilota]|uniref:Prostate-associated microseminoprotein n=1 Tax=Holothuria leucospilota TaxID=206669 RepID=A0A9Q1CQU1_HOLLE|nr:Prostate-associated microseminoprotein [Holothuria leucospilota]